MRKISYSPLATSILVIFFICNICFACQENRTENESLIFVGDTNLGRSLGERLKKNEGQNFVESLKKILEPHTVRIVNVECVFTNENTAREKEFVIKAMPEHAKFLREAGITHGITANNHAYDYGLQAYSENKRVLNENGIHCIEDIQKIETHQSASFTLSGKKVKVFALLYLPDRLADSLVARHIRLEKFLQAIKETKQNEPETYIIASLHFGTEYHPYAKQSERDLASKIIQSGADALVGHHPHVVRNVEFIAGKPVIYSLGNFVFDQYREESKNGCAFILRFDKNGKAIFSLQSFRIEKAIPKIHETAQKNAFFEKLKEKSPDVIFTDNGDEMQIEDKTDPASLSYYRNLDNYPVFLPDTSAFIHDDFEHGEIVVKQKKALAMYEFSFSDAKTGKKSYYNLRYPLYRFALGDVNEDGKTNIFIGVVKTTKFDPMVKKRLFIFQIHDGIIKPLWLGSRLEFPVCDFTVFNENKNIFVKTLEKNYEELYCISIYDYGNFGLKQIRKIYENLHENEAKKLFYGQK
jgi:poly-gamma-glutamate synthesis protein (capsule biosynthesis protein)